MSDVAKFLRVRVDEEEQLAKNIRDDDSSEPFGWYDPARVLREVEADRKLLAEYEARDKDVELMLGPNVQRQREWSGLYLAVRIRASIHAGHPDYQQEWKP